MVKHILIGLLCATGFISGAAAQSPELESRQFFGKVFLDETLTLEGVVELNGDDLTPWDIQDRVRYFTTEQLNSGRVRRRDKQQFTPGKILGFAIDERTYLARRYAPESLLGGGRGTFYFMELLVDGPIQVFAYYDSPPAIMAGTAESIEETRAEHRIPVFLIEKEGMPLRCVTRIDLMDYISDVPEIVHRYNEGYYGMKPVNHEERRGLGRMIAQAVDRQLLAEQIIPLIIDYNAALTGFETED